MLPRPTVELVEIECEAFDHENWLAEKGRQQQQLHISFDSTPMLDRAVVVARPRGVLPSSPELPIRKVRKHPRNGEHGKPFVVNSVGEMGIITPSKCLEATVLLALAAFQEVRIMGQFG